MFYDRLLVALLGGCAFLTAACEKASDPPPDPPRNVVLVLVDTLRADRLGVYGNQRGLTPFMDELAAQGTVFLNAYSTSSYTVPAVASLFTSRYTSQHRVINADSPLADSEITLAEQLLEAGYTTAAFVANIQVNPEYGYPQGFQHFFAMDVLKMRADTIRARVRQWLDDARPSHTPVFLYLHYFEPHYPYKPPEPFRSRFRLQSAAVIDEQKALQNAGPGDWHRLSQDDVSLLASLYDAEVASFDAQLRLQFDELRQRGVLDKAIVVITADHGEEFRDHGEMGHGRSLYQEQVWIPLIMAGPNIAARLVYENVSLIDVAPTLLELIGRPAPRPFEGRSLARHLRSRGVTDLLGSFGALFGAPSNPPILFELERMSSKYDMRRHTAGIIDGSAKLLHGRDGEELYDLGADLGETNPQPSRHRVDAVPLRAMLTAVRQEIQRRAAPESGKKPLDPSTKEKLRALGYDPE